VTLRFRWVAGGIVALGWCSASVLFAACGKGSGGEPASGTAVTCGPFMYILDGSCQDFPAFSDAAVQFGDSPGDDAGAGDDAGPGDARATDATDATDEGGGMQAATGVDEPG
jgi:hypothetical protein